MLLHGCFIEASASCINASLETLLVQMYAQCRSPADASAVLKKMKLRSSSLWNLVVKSFALDGDIDDAFDMFEKAKIEGAIPSKSACIKLLSSCRTKDDLARGKKLHRFITTTAFASDVFVMTAILRMYGKCGCLEGSCQAFAEMEKKDLISYTTMIGVYAQNGKGIEAIRLLNQMEHDGFKPDTAAFVSALDACDSYSHLPHGLGLHDSMKKYGIEGDVIGATALIKMYGKCGNLDAARELFDRMPERNVISWNTMLSAYAQHKRVAEAMRIMKRMHDANVKPDRVSLLIMLDACANCKLQEEGEQIHSLILKEGLDGDITLGNALVNMYGKCDNLRKASEIFDSMPDHDLVSWNTMITIHAQQRQSQSIPQLVNQMQQEGLLLDNVSFVSIFNAFSCSSAVVDAKRFHGCIMNSRVELDVVVSSAIVNMYGKCGDLEEAKRMYHKIVEKNVIACNTMISLYVQHDQIMEAFEIFTQMQNEGISPDEVTFSCMLDACARYGALAKGGKLHLLIIESGHQFDTILVTSLVYMYGKCGNLDEGMRAFEGMPGQDMVSLTAMAAVYAQHGRTIEAVKLSQNKTGLEEDDVMLVSILSGCSHSGLMEEACYYFTWIFVSSHTVLPAIEHYVSMIDLLGRAGCLNKAEAIVNEMPINVPVAPFLSLLGACMYHIDVERGERMIGYILEVDDSVSPYVTLSNIYSAAHN
jgi:pentatricopeptide repeat protein